MRAYCSTKWEKSEYSRYNEEDKEQIQFCRDNKMNFERSAWDDSIKCIKIEE